VRDENGGDAHLKMRNVEKEVHREAMETESDGKTRIYERWDGRARKGVVRWVQQKLGRKRVVEKVPRNAQKMKLGGRKSSMKSARGKGYILQSKALRRLLLGRRTSSVMPSKDEK